MVVVGDDDGMKKIFLDIDLRGSLCFKCVAQVKSLGLTMKFWLIGYTYTLYTYIYFRESHE